MDQQKEKVKQNQKENVLENGTKNTYCFLYHFPEKTALKTVRASFFRNPGIKQE